MFTNFDKVLIMVSTLALIIVLSANSFLATQQAQDFELDKMKIFNKENCTKSMRPPGATGGETPVK